MEQIAKVISHFSLDSGIAEIKPIVQGHINATYLIILDNGRKYTLQAINNYVFRKPEKVMENIVNVTEHIRKKIELAGGDTERECLNVIPTREGNNLYIDKNCKYWRMYTYVDDVTTYDVVEKPEQMYNAGVGFGRFQKMLSDFEMSRLHETIPNFHNTRTRLADLFRAAEENLAGRIDEVREDIEFFRQRIADATILVDLTEQGKLPLRVTHNDTKVNNILIDDATGKALCVIDLDTVMPGLTAIDFGDTIRYAANTAAEDEQDTNKVALNMELYEQYTKGFLSEVAEDLTETELAYLAHGAKIVTLETGARFLTDYLNGDVYFSIHRPGQNLDRARCQMALVRSMEEHFEEMQQIVLKTCKK